jgi:cytosine/adenosine deaminase-related metal-dependent hydrolase
MKAYSADLIYTMCSAPLKDGVVIIRNDGLVADVCSREEAIAAGHTFEILSGIICPGFINAHCHLELSHMKEVISPKTGMAGFIQEILTKRGGLDASTLPAAIDAADKQMRENGIVAVGDISNTSDTFETKKRSEILYHTFIEIFSMDPAKANESMERGRMLQKQLSDAGLSSSISPHAPYTMSKELLSLINRHSKKDSALITIHNQESEAESELFEKAEGSLMDTFRKLGLNTALLRKTGENSIRSTLPYLKDAARILLVHNTFSRKEDLRYAAEIHKNVYWCTCPKANLYIENTLPDYDMFIAEKAKLVVGTDSLASNDSLSVLEELITIHEHYQHIPLETLLLWATNNGAELFGSDNLGTIEKGKTPGLNLISGIRDGLLNKGCKVKKLV